MKKLTLRASMLLASLGLLTEVDGAFSINVLAGESFGSDLGSYLDSTSQHLSEGALLRFGTFDVSGYNQLSEASKLQFSSVDGLFTEVGTRTANASGYFLGAASEFSTLPSGVATGDKLYTWVFNSSNANQATQWGIFSSSNSQWEVPADEGPTKTLSNATIDEAVFGTLGTTTEAGRNANLQAIPEPSSYAAILGFLGLGYAVFCRRRRSSSRE